MINQCALNLVFFSCIVCQPVVSLLCELVMHTRKKLPSLRKVGFESVSIEF